MQILSTIMITAAVFDLLFAFIVFWKARTKQRSLVGYYLLLFGTLAVWEVLMWMAFFRNYSVALNGVIDQLTVIIGIGVLFLFTLFYWILIEKQFLSKAQVWVLGSLNMLVALVGAIPGTYYKGRIYFSELAWEQYLEPGALLPVSYIVAVCNLAALLYLVFKFWRSDEEHAKRARGLLVGFASVAVLILNFSASVIVPFTVKSVIESQYITFASWYLTQQIVAIILLSLLSFTVAYAITRYRFLNIKVETRKQTMHRIIQLSTFVGISVVVTLVLLPNAPVSLLLAVVLISAICICALGVYALLFNRRSLVHFLFFLTCISLVLWLISSYICLQTFDLNHVRWHSASVGIKLAAFFSFSYAYTAPRTKKSIFVFAWVMGLTVAAVSIWGNTFSAIITDAVIPYPIIGPGMFVYGPLSVLMALGSIALYLPVVFSKESGPKRYRARMIMSGFLFMLTCMIVFSFVLVAFFETTRYIPVAILSTLVFAVLTTLAITRYRFLEIRIEMKQHIAYAGILCAVLLALAAFGIIGADFYGIIASVVVILILGFLYFLFVDQYVRFALDSIFFLKTFDPSKAFTYDERKFDSYKAVWPWFKKWYDRFDEDLDIECKGMFLLQRQHNRISNPLTRKHIWLENPFMKEALEKGTGVYSVSSFESKLPRKAPTSTVVVICVHHGMIQSATFLSVEEARIEELESLAESLLKESVQQVQYYESVEGAKRTVKELIYKGD